MGGGNLHAALVPIALLHNLAPSSQHSFDLTAALTTAQTSAERFPHTLQSQSLSLPAGEEVAGRPGGEGGGAQNSPTLVLPFAHYDATHGGAQ